MAAKKVAKPVSRWEALKREAKKNYSAPDPYVFDGANPPVEITAPDTLERSLALASMLDSRGGIAIRDMEPMILALVGRDAFPVVWDAIRDEPVDVAMALIDDINRHFDAVPDAGADDLPGGESAS
ncbi:hypothetical protein [Nocardia terpenica]|uniref:Tail assembly chaperone n=1 Tax=Nocardia terpenica TaxID=455432 RepID=A0A164K5N7_9NOCA|nr:hypothetical protein [Nocardia terpenica]KZM71060.1 hypothetical protein AWN90_41835 [Nocardia terpenica]NQE89619.1 hypothetical protein [Nocardia terpenica]